MQNSFGEFLRQKRQEKKLTQKELSKMLFVSESAVSKWEKNVAHPDITLLPKLAEILGVTEHELITASIDNKAREEKIQAKRWRTFSFTWSLFFYIAYVVALIPCFICNLAIDKTLSWFWIVLSALILAFTFTNLPKLIKKHKLLLIPLSQYLALVLLLGVCCIYTNGNWFFIASLSVLLGLVMIFMPIYIAKYKVFSSIKKYNDFISIAIDFVLLNILLIVINLYTLTEGDWWYLSLALPITLGVYMLLNALLYVRFLKTNRYIKTSIILFLINVITYISPLLVKVKNPAIQSELDDINILKANLSKWVVGQTIEQNVHLIIFLTTLLVSVTFLLVGIVRNHRKNIAKNPDKN
ncbi:MAG: helix-turn-helix transcriptional regulator [Clostridia bacterium]|nr:helix-turn-helix transcriptional regulator [Clostridia bacterium]